MPTRAELDAAYRRNVQRLRAAQAAALERTWRGLGQWTGRGDHVDRWATTVLPLMIGTQRQVAAQTIAYTNMTTGGRAALSLDDFVGAALRGVDYEGVVRRPFGNVWNSLAAGKPYDKAVDIGLQRAQTIAATDAQLAKTHSADAALRANGVRKYRRVLNGAVNCGLCVASASKFYNVGDLAPIHGGCDCGVVGVLDERAEEVELAYAEDAYKEALEAAGATDAKSLLAEKVATRQHGEIGPVLTWRDQHFKTAAQSFSGTPA